MLETFNVQIKGLDKERTIRVHLPEDYYTYSDKAYPVLYMHDGQNLFHDEESVFGKSWGLVDYFRRHPTEVIVVGIDSIPFGNERMNEYSPWPNNKHVQQFFGHASQCGGEGAIYTAFIAEQLKPMVDQKYRTNPDFTMMAGSSMGGFITAYAACQYPHIFKRAAAISPACWFNQVELERMFDNSDVAKIEKFYLDVGTKESISELMTNEYYEESCKSFYQHIKNRFTDMKFQIIEEAEHNEDYWRDRFGGILDYLLSPSEESQAEFRRLPLK
jgi:predicted alpha/beta superfamily hydrolase